MSAPAATRPRGRARHVNLLANAAGSASIIFIPLYARQFRATNGQIGFIVAAFCGFVLFSSFVFGRSADLHGVRRFLRAGLALNGQAHNPRGTGVVITVGPHPPRPPVAARDVRGAIEP